MINLIDKTEILKVKGIHEISVYELKNDQARFTSNKLELVRMKRDKVQEAHISKFIKFRKCKDLWDEYKYWLKILNGKFLVDQKIVENIVVQTGNNVQAQRLAGITTYTGIANYCAIGTGTATPAYSDTQLTTESQRQTLSGANAVGNVTLLGTYFGPGVATGTWQEYGFFIDGSGTANSGQLWNHFTQVQVVTALQPMNVESTFTFINS